MSAAMILKFIIFYFAQKGKLSLNGNVVIAPLSKKAFQITNGQLTKNKLFHSCPQKNELLVRYPAVSLEFAVVTY